MRMLPKCFLLRLLLLAPGTIDPLDPYMKYVNTKIHIAQRNSICGSQFSCFTDSGIPTCYLWER